jgi:hypothetical protein
VEWGHLFSCALPTLFSYSSSSSSSSGLAVRLFVFQVPALFPGGEGDAFAGVAEGAQLLGMDVEVFGIG